MINYIYDLYDMINEIIEDDVNVKREFMWAK